MKIEKLIQRKTRNSLLKKTMTVIAFFCLSLSAMALSQNRITLSNQTITLETAFSEIEKQTNLSVDYEESKINVSRLVNVAVEDMDLNAALETILRNTGYVYTIKGSHIIISLPSRSVDDDARKKTISGNVTDDKGEPVIGANIVEKGTTNGTITDMDGNFELNVADNATLIISYIGYVQQEILATGPSLRIRLREDSQALDEVVVVGYGTQKKVNLTGAVAQIGDKQLSNRPVTNVGKALQGTIANLNMSVSSTDGGSPGASMDYNIRGTTSLSGGGPLFIVDGVPVDDINSINPSDIETLTVLKDAASAAIYGARASFGVILVTTKSGSKDQKAVVSYNNMFGYNHQTIIPNQVNSLDFANAYNIASINSGQSPMFSEEHIARIKAYMADPVNTPSNIPNPNNPDYWSYATLDNDNVDWYRTFFKPGAWNQKHDLSIKGGGSKMNYYVNAGYYRENSFLRYADDTFDRLNLTSNLHYEPYKWLKGDLRIRFNHDQTDRVSDAYNSDIGNWVHLSTTRQPNWMLKDPNGHWAQTSHMYKQIEGGRTKNNVNVFSVTGAFEINPLPGWKINLDYTYRNTFSKSSTHAKPVIIEYTVSNKPVMSTAFDGFTAAQSQKDYHSFNVYTSYEKTISDHYMSVLVGEQLELSKYDYLSGERRNLITHEMPSLAVGVGTQLNSQQLQHWANMGVFIRANYNYKEKYLVEFNARYDGSSKFQRGNRFGFFPSVSAGYNIAKEDFWNFDEYINSLKIRASWGTLGNQNVADYLYLSTIGIGTNYGYIINGERPNYLDAPGLVSRKLTWETVSTIDVGFDAALWSNRLMLSFDWYNRTTKDMFGPANALPAVLGAAVPQENNADLRTRGVELTIGWRDQIGEDFKYNVNFVFSDNKSEIIKYNNPTKLLSTSYEGQQIGEIWGYKTVGIIQTEDQLKNMPDQSYIYGTWGLGDIEYQDLNKDGKIDIGENTLEDHGDLEIIGNTSPRFSYGISLGAEWKGIDLNVFLQGVGKRDFYPPISGNSGVFFWGFTGGFGSNLYEETSDFWTEDNTDAYYAKPYNSEEVKKNQQTQTRYLQNAAYLRLKNLQIGYTIPTAIVNKIRMSRIRIFFSGENLFTLTPLHKNFDPELTSGSWGAGKLYPLSRTISFGVNIDF